MHPASLTVAIVAGWLAAAAAETIHVRTSEDVARAAKAAAATNGTDPLIVEFDSGIFELADTFRILRSNVELRGNEETTLRLADEIQRPVIAVGNQEEIPPEESRIRSIRIRDLAIDGNRDEQWSETSAERPWIRNNGIDVRMTSDLAVENVQSNRNRSGGLVISWKSENITVRSSSFADNFYDGVAYYDSRNVQTIDCVMQRNRGAGISLDNEFVDSSFTGCRLVENGDVGIFMRASERIRFERCEILESGNWGAFLAHDGADRGVHDIRFLHCTFTKNNGGVRMASITEAQSSGISVEDCRFAGNHANGRASVDTAGVPVQESP